MIDQGVVMGTPVDTGRARSNWIVTTGAPNESVIAPYSPGHRLGSGESENASAAMDHARTVISTQYQAEGQHIFITNNVHYIGKLNRGSSPQAASYYVQAAIVAAIAGLKEVRLLRRS